MYSSDIMTGIRDYGRHVTSGLTTPLFSHGFIAPTRKENIYPRLKDMYVCIGTLYCKLHPKICITGPIDI